MRFESLPGHRRDRRDSRRRQSRVPASRSRPGLEKALALAHQFKEAAPETPVIFTVHALKRLARNAAELMTLSAELQAGGIQLELLTGPLTGIYDPQRHGRHVLRRTRRRRADRAQLHPGEDPLKGQVIATAKGNHGGRPKVIDDDSLTLTLTLKDKDVPVPDIAKKPTIKTGKNAGKSPSVASLYRALAEAEQTAADDGLPIRPKPVRIRHPDDLLTPEKPTSANASRPRSSSAQRTSSQQDQSQRQPRFH